MNLHRIAVVTGSRAEYGLLKPLIEKIKNEKTMNLQLIVTGMHLSPEFGLTYTEIEKDGFAIAEKTEILLSSLSSTGILKAMGLAMISLSEIYERLKPDIVILLGDRFEIFSAAVSAYASRIPVAHIHGGEVTQGAFDEAFRHSITKMSHLHFTACETYRKRIIQLGESPDRVFSVGALGLDNIRNLKLLSREELERELSFIFHRKNLLVTYHPVTLEGSAVKQFRTILGALDRLKDTGLIFTKANADPEGMIVNGVIDEYVSRNVHKAISVTSMGQLKYLSTMQFVDGVVGNSSSGIIEAPSFHIGTINIGDRQKGRIKPESVIDCEPSKASMDNAIKKLYSMQFKAILKNVVNPYGDGRSAPRIMKILKSCRKKTLSKKVFYDMEYAEYKK